MRKAFVLALFLLYAGAGAAEIGIAAFADGGIITTYELERRLALVKALAAKIGAPVPADEDALKH